LPDSFLITASKSRACWIASTVTTRVGFC